MMKRKQNFINLRKTLQNNPFNRLRLRLGANYLNLIKLSQSYKTEKKHIEEVKNIILNSKQENLHKIQLDPASGLNTSLLQTPNYFKKIDMVKKNRIIFNNSSGGAQIWAGQNKNVKKLSIDQVIKSKNLPGLAFNHNIIGLSAINKENIKIAKTDTLQIINPNNEVIMLPVKNSTLTNNKQYFKKNLEVAQKKNIFYLFNNTNLIKNITTILENSFLQMSSIISKPVFYITPSKVIIQLFFFSFWLLGASINKKQNNAGRKNKKDFLKIYLKKLELLCANLSKFINKPIELDLIKLYSSLNDSTILTNVLSRISDINFRPYILLLDKVFYNAKIKNPKNIFPNLNSIIPSYITGIKIKLGGRLLKTKIRPKVSSKTTQLGSLTRSSADMISKGRYTSKNKRGIFSFTATIGYRFY